MIARNLLMLKPATRVARGFGKKMSDYVNVEQIEEDPDFSPKIPLASQNYNYNREQYPGYEKKVKRAMEQRDLIEELKKNPIPERRERRVYDRPVFDENIENYDVFREFSDVVLTKEYPHSLPIVCEIEVSPKDFVHCFGRSLGVTRNDNYSLNEWDFTDSNLDKYLVYDFKASTDYWGENLPDEWYEVSR